MIVDSAPAVPPISPIRPSTPRQPGPVRVPVPAPAPRPAAAVALVAARMLAGRQSVQSRVRAVAARPEELLDLAEDLQYGFASLAERYAAASGGRLAVVAGAAASLEGPDLELLVDGGLLPSSMARPGIRSSARLPASPPVDAPVPPADTEVVRQVVATVELFAALLRAIAASAGGARAWADLRRWRALDGPGTGRPAYAVRPPRSRRPGDFVVGTPADVDAPLVDLSEKFIQPGISPR
jgi:putative hemolysin